MALHSLLLLLLLVVGAAVAVELASGDGASPPPFSSPSPSPSKVAEVGNRYLYHRPGIVINRFYHSSSRPKWELILFICVCVLLVIAVIGSICFYLWGKKRRAASERPPEPQTSGFGSTFTFAELEVATEGFSDAHLLGQGGFGFVYSGELPNGMKVAIKKLRHGSSQGEREFQAEVDIGKKIHHRNIVNLIGYCMYGAERLLVYEFVPNGTLHSHLHGKDRPSMEWATRFKIAVGIAKGLAYLHHDCNPTIIHRDIKATNILLDDTFEPKVADLGLAKVAADSNSQLLTRAMGTHGYMAPEYARFGIFSYSSDVFCYGVLLLELITGKPALDLDPEVDYPDNCLSEWARPRLIEAYNARICSNLIDRRLGIHSSNEMDLIVACAAACVCENRKDRPTMSQIVRVLEGDVSLEDLTRGVVRNQNERVSPDGNNLTIASSPECV